MTGLVWGRDGAHWPNRAASRFVDAAGIRWHVQTMGEGPPLLLLHGTGASTHSWRGLAPILAQHFTVVAPDLPGHAFTQAPAPPRLSLPGMASDIASLAAKVRERVPRASIERVQGGHLAHEEWPETVAEIILRRAKRVSQCK